MEQIQPVLTNHEFVPDTFSGFRKLHGTQYFRFKEITQAEIYSHVQISKLVILEMYK